MPRLARPEGSNSRTKREPGDGVHRYGEPAVEPGLGAELAGDLGRELRDVGVDPLLDRDQALTQLLILGSGDPELHRDREDRAREVVPEQVEQGPDPGRPVGRKLAGALAVVLDPLLGQALEGADDEVDPVREVVALGALGDTGELGHAPDRGAGVADLDQALDRRVEQPSAGLGAALGLRPPRRRGLTQAISPQPSLITTAPASDVVSYA